MSRVREETAVLLLAVQLLTRWPVRVPGEYSPERFAAATRYYALTGALIGAFAGAVFWLAHLVFPASLAVILSTVATLLATGAMHEDGFADTCDGLGGGTTRDHALESCATADSEPTEWPDSASCSRQRCSPSPRCLPNRFPGS